MLRSLTIQPWTIPVVVFVGFVLIVANTTGKPWAMWPPAGGNRFGWPLVYLSTPFSDSQWAEFLQRGPRPPLLISPGAVPWRADVLEAMSATAIGANLATALVILITAGLFVDHGQRLLKHPIPFSQRSLLVLVALAALIMAGARSAFVTCALLRLYYTQLWLSVFLQFVFGIGIVIATVTMIELNRRKRSRPWARDDDASSLASSKTQ